MKKVFVSVLLSVLMIASLVYAQTHWTMVSSKQTNSASITTGSGYFHGLFFVTDGASGVTVEVFDNTSASGKELMPQTPILTSATNKVHTISFDPPVFYDTGIYVRVTGSSGATNYMVYFTPS